MAEEPTTPHRWSIVEYRTGGRAGNQPMDGFATQDEAEAWHRDQMGGDMRYVFRRAGMEDAGAGGEGSARERGTAEPGENIEIARSAIEAFNSGDMDLILALTHADFELEVPPDLSAEPDTYRGHAGMRRYWESFQDAMDEIRIRPERLEVAGESVMVVMHLTARGRSTGIAVEQRIVGVWTIRDTKVMSIRAFASLNEALDAAGLTA